jgi:TolB protein
MLSKNFFVIATLAAVLSTQMGCKSSTSPNNNNGSGSGTIVFGEAIDEVASTSLGSNTSSVLFHGNDPSFTSNGKILYDLLGGYTANSHEQITMANADGTGASTVVDLGGYNSYLYRHPKMSPDSRYVVFNYWGDDAGAPFGATSGTAIVSGDGTYIATIANVWDVAWASDGSLIVASTITTLEGTYTYNNTPGLFKYDKTFQTVTQIGAPGELTTPQFPAVSPDGKTVAFSMNNHIWTIGMDGSNLKQITAGPNEETYACWSPDGSSIACVSLGDVGLTSGNGLAIVPSNPATPTTVSQNTSVWVKDNTNGTTGLLSPFGNISWR